MHSLLHRHLRSLPFDRVVHLVAIVDRKKWKPRLPPWDHPLLNLLARTAKETQFYSMLGTRAIWHQGWKAVTEHGPFTDIGKFDQDRWQLFHTDVDRSEANDLAAEQPAPLQRRGYARLGQADEAGVAHDQRRRLRDQRRRQGSGVGALQIDHARIGGDGLVHLAKADIDGEHAGRAAIQQDLGEAARRRPDI